jgi:hypothetical protein
MPWRKRCHRYDYRKGVTCANGVPRAYQPRKGGPPLLFATDIRMTILVHLALAPGTVRIGWLWKHLGKKAPTALYPLVERGLVMKWKWGGKTFVALDPCHPAATPLRAMLIAIGKKYRFRPMPIDVDAREGGDVPSRPSRLRDVRDTFGDKNRTMPLLLVHVLGEAMSTDIARVVPYLEKTTTLDVLYMYRAFKLLKSRHKVIRKRHGEMFAFNEDHWLVPYVRAVLAALDKAMPQWRASAERKKGAPIPKKDDRRDGRRKSGRWKW